MSIKYDGIYTSTINEYKDTDYLRFYKDGVVIYGRARKTLANIMRWFGKDANETYDGSGVLSLDGDNLQFDIKTDHTVIEYRGTITNSGLQFHLKWGRREANNLYTFVDIDLDHFKQINDQELLKNIDQKKLDELPKYLRDKEKDWWILADQRGWHCKNCKKLIMIGERECYFDTNYCSGCYTESFRSNFY